ncbi:TetR/AcrR family transcriptional regulator [uncultured Phenylobacterium sp.]|uniref:TetR/AcrR family transcriptional regulator n=1 Tax=uncultured Phenylobacterium sp. TaxID=349273 RepID=UPI0025DDE59B|nr:TetR/AcrR family transcriptional regulator [uncultured Phenylobacterium sp.]
MKADSAARRRSQRDRREQSGRGLVEAVVQIVSEHGVAAATFEAIGGRAGYSRSLVTQRFGSRQGLIDAVIEHASASFADVAVERPMKELSGLEALLLSVEVFLTRLADSPELRTYFLMLAASVAELSELRAVFAAQHDRVKGNLMALIALGQADGSIRSEVDPDAAALMIGSLQLGVSIQLLVDPKTDVGPILRTALSTIRGSFAAPPGVAAAAAGRTRG